MRGVLLRALPDACLDRLFLLFPDPWPKARHAKRRFVHPAMLPELARVLKPGARMARRQRRSDLSGLGARGDGARRRCSTCRRPPPTRPEGWPPTRYEAKALRAGRQPLYWSLRRR